MGGVIQGREGIGRGKVVGIGAVVTGEKAAGYDIVVDTHRDKAGVAARGSYGAGIHQRSQGDAIVIVTRIITEHEESLQMIF